MDRISTDTIFNKTFGYVFFKVLMPVASLVVSLIAMKIITAIGGGTLGIVGTIIWLIITVGFAFGLDFFLGYTFRAGHVAVVTDAVSVGMIPDDMKAMAKESVTYRFPTCNEYLAYRRSVMGAISQLQKQLNTFAERKRNTPVLGQLISIAQIFIGMALSFVYDLILAYTFWRDGKPLYTSAADGVAIYYNCWKRIVENVLMLAVEIIVAMFVVFVFVFALSAPILTSSFGTAWGGGLAAAATAYFICTAIKTFIDSRLMITTMTPFFEEAQYAEITEDEYAAACDASPKYRKLLQKADSEGGYAPVQNDGGYMQ